MPAAREFVMLSRLLIVPWWRARDADHWGRFVLTRTGSRLLERNGDLGTGEDLSAEGGSRVGKNLGWGEDLG